MVEPLSIMSPAILLVPVDPLPLRADLDAVAGRLERLFNREVRVMEPVGVPAASRLGPDRCSGEGVRAALAATWGCGCRGRIVGLTAAEVVGGGDATGCGGVLVLSLPAGAGHGPVVREVGRSLGLEDCAAPGCAMNPCGESAELCHACRGRC